MRYLILATILCNPTISSAQAFSESMADCASLYQNAAQWASSDKEADWMMKAAMQWANAAVVFGAAERQTTTDEQIWQRIDRKTAEWEAQGPNVFFSQEYREWSQYCRKFAMYRSIETYPAYEMEWESRRSLFALNSVR